MREFALARRHAKQEDKLTEHTKVLPGLKISDVVLDVIMYVTSYGLNGLKKNSTRTCLQDIF